jgi:hypothetical protein
MGAAVKVCHGLKLPWLIEELLVHLGNRIQLRIFNTPVVIASQNLDPVQLGPFQHIYRRTVERY